MTHNTDTVSLLRTELETILAGLEWADKHINAVDNTLEIELCHKALAAPVAAIQPAGGNPDGYIFTGRIGIAETKLVCKEYSSALELRVAGDIIPYWTTPIATSHAAASAPAQPEAKGEAPGMPVEQERKYGIRDNRLYNRASGEFIPLDEPVFIFRARDMKGKKHIAAYAEDCKKVNIEHYRAVVQRVGDFSLFALKHPERMKYPDTAPVPAAPADKGELPKSEHLIDHYHDDGTVTSESGYTAEQVQACILADRARQAADMDRMRSAFHVNMLRAYPGKSHEEIASEIDKACGQAAIAQPSGAAGWRDTLKRISEWLKSSARDQQIGPDEFAPASQFDYELSQAGAEIDGILAVCTKSCRGDCEECKNWYTKYLAAAPQPPSTGSEELWIHEDMHHDATQALVNSPRKELQSLFVEARASEAHWKRRALTAENSTRTAALIDAASKERGGDAEARERNLELVITRLEQIAGNFSTDYREDAEQALVCARAIATTKATQ